MELLITKSVCFQFKKMFFHHELGEYTHIKLFYKYPGWSQGGDTKGKIHLFYFIGNRVLQNRSARLPNFLAKFGPKVAYLKLTVAYFRARNVNYFRCTSIVYFKTLINRLLSIRKKLPRTSNQKPVLIDPFIILKIKKHTLIWKLPKFAGPKIGPPGCLFFFCGCLFPAKNRSELPNCRLPIK